MPEKESGMKYIVLMEQEGGCDYTIGCGNAWDIIEAENKQALLTKLFDDPDTDEDDQMKLGGEGCPNTIYAYALGEEIIEEDEVQKFYDALVKKRKKIKSDANKKKQEEEERATYNALKAKYG